MNSPAVSVVMGVYNGATALTPTLESVLGQGGVDLECVVVDDGSTDETWKVLERLAAGDPRLRMHHQPRGGLTKALIAGCAMARGEFIARQDVGDISLPGRFQKQCNALAAQPELAFVACQFVMVGPAGEVLGPPTPSDQGKAITSSLKETPASGMHCPQHGSVMFRRSAYERVGGYRAEYYFAQDLDLWSRLIEVGVLAFLDEVLYQSSFAPGDISALHRAEQLVLRDLIREGALCRRQGQSETRTLQRAALIRPKKDLGRWQTNTEANYFIGSCLFHRRDRNAAAYFRRAIESNPLHIKAWFKLIAGQFLYRA